MTNQILIKIYIYILIIIIVAIILTTKIHPTYIILILIVFRILVCLTITWSIINPILSIILFIIIIRGVLIIFLYFSSLVSNEQTKNKLNLTTLTFIIIIILITINYNKIDIINNEEKQTFLSTNEYTLSNIKIIYEHPYVFISIKCIIYLIISMFAIIKVCSSKNSTLRKINN